MEISMEVPQKTKNSGALWSTIPLLGIYPKECKSIYKREICILMFITALFIIAKLWDQQRCPTTVEWTKKIWNLSIREYYSAIKKSEIMSFTGKWIEMEIMMLGEISQA
jgi:hypothetical protein